MYVAHRTTPLFIYSVFVHADYNMKATNHAEHKDLEDKINLWGGGGLFDFDILGNINCLPL